MNRNPDTRLTRDALSRRGFVKRFVMGTATATVFGKLWQASVFADATPSGTGILRIRISDYPALSTDFGSVRLGINPIEDPAGPLGNFYPILITRESSETYYALDTACRHAGCIVPPYEESEGAIRCACHGSGYWIDGRVLNGPAVSDLVRFPLAYDGVDTITVEIPNLGYSVNVSAVQGGTSRLRLDFPSIMAVEYEVKSRPTVNGAWTTVPFALTAEGEADQLSIVGDDTVRSLYVTRTGTAGIFSVAIKLLDLTVVGGR